MLLFAWREVAACTVEIGMKVIGIIEILHGVV
jgi:hypothetical protein